MKPKIILRVIIVSLVLISLAFGGTIYHTFNRYGSLVLVEDMVEKIQTDVFQRRLVADDYLMYKNERSKRQWLIKQAEISEFITSQRHNFSNDTDLNLFTQIETAVLKSDQIFAEIVALAENNSDNTENLTRLITQLTSKAQETVSLAGELNRQVSVERLGALHNLVLLFTLLISIYLLLLVVSFCVIWRSVGILQTVDEMKSDFVSLVSHQLKTPSAQIKGYTDNMLDGLTGPITDKQREYLQDMFNVADKNSKLIDDLLNVSRIERRMLKVNIESLPFQELVNDVLSPLRTVAEAKGVKLVEKLSTESVKVQGDSVKTREALRNIVDNAIKFTEPSKSVTVETLPDGINMRFAVTDEGPGIDPDVETEIFSKNRVWTGKVKASGAGLGLYLSKQFIELTGGSISYSTKPGKGTTFVIKLPISK